jgi:hypothetical protein
MRNVASAARRRGAAAATPEHLIDRMLRNVSHGRFERSMAALTAVSAVITTVEVYYEHYKGGFGHKMMWSPIVITPPVVAAGIGGVFSRRIAKTWLPLTSAIYAADGLLGEWYHLRGIGRRPGGWEIPTYNIAMGPPMMAPGLFAMVGGMGLLAAILRREV